MYVGAAYWTLQQLILYISLLADISIKTTYLDQAGVLGI